MILSVRSSADRNAESRLALVQGRIGLLSLFLLPALVLAAGCGGGGGGGGEKQASAAVRITNGNPENVCYWDASVSQDGKRLLFQAGLNIGGGIWTETLAGGKATGSRTPVARKVTGSSPVFVGTDRVAFLNEISTLKRELVVMNLGGSPQRIMTADSPFDLAATPDGTWLLYTTSTAGGEALHRIRPDGSGDEVLFTDPVSIDEPAVSPDGTRIAYVRSPSGSPASALWTAHLDGSARAKVAQGNWPAWSPDGTRLAYVGPAGKAEDGLPLVQVFVVPSEGGAPRAITDSEHDKRGSLVWLGNRKVAYLFGSATANYCQLFAANAAG